MASILSRPQWVKYKDWGGDAGSGGGDGSSSGGGGDGGGSSGSSIGDSDGGGGSSSIDQCTIQSHYDTANMTWC